MIFSEGALIWFSAAVVFVFLSIILLDCVTVCEHCDKQIFVSVRNCPYCKHRR